MSEAVSVESSGPEVVEWELDCTPEQEPAVRELASILGGFAHALVACREVGLEPAAALRACGVEIPALAVPMVNAALRG